MKKNRPTQEDVRAKIEELKQMGNEVALRLAESLEKDLQDSNSVLHGYVRG